MITGVKDEGHRIFWICDDRIREEGIRSNVDDMVIGLAIDLCRRSRSRVVRSGFAIRVVVGILAMY